MRWWRSPWTWSLWLHAAVLGTVAVYFGTRPEGVLAPPDAAVGGAVPRGTAAETVAADATRRLAEAVAGARNQTPQQQFDNTLNYARKLEAVGRPESMAEIGQAFGRAMSFSQRAFAPAAKPPAGDFDVESQLPYAVRSAAGPEGRTVKRIVWVDKAGRTKEEELTPKHPLAGSPLAIAALERLEGSATLRSFMDEVLLKVVDKLLDDKK